MPTTLFVLRQRGDQRVPHGRPHLRHDARRARQRHHAAALLHLRDRLQFWDSAYAAALTVVLLLLLGRARLAAVRASSSAGRTTDERMSAARTSTSAPVGARAGDRGGLAAGPPLAAAARSTRSGRRSIPPPTHALRPRRAAHAGEFRQGLAAAPFARYFLNTMHAGDDGASIAQMRARARSPPTPSRASTFRGRDVAVRAVLAAADDHARRARSSRTTAP